MRLIVIFFILLHGLAFGQARVDYPYTYPIYSVIFPSDTISEYKIYLYTDLKNCIQIEYNRTGYDTSFTVSPDSWFDLTSLIYWRDFIALSNDSITKNSLFVNSLYPISIFIANGATNTLRSNEIKTSSPARRLTNEYLVYDKSIINIHHPVSMYIFAMEDSTTIDYTLSSPSVTGIPAHSPRQIILDKGERWYLNSVVGERFNLSKISSPLNKPIEVSVGDNGPGIIMDSCDSLHFNAFSKFSFINRFMQRILPVHKFSKTYLLHPIDSQPAQIFNLVSAHDANDIFLNKQYITTLNKAESFDTCLTSSNILEASKGVGVMRMITGAHDANGDNWRAPTIINETGFDLKMQRTAFFVSPLPLNTQSLLSNPNGFHINHFYLSIQCLSKDTTNFLLNNQAFRSHFNTFSADTNYAWACVPIDSGFYVLENPGGFTSFLFGRTPINQHPYPYDIRGHTIDAIGTTLEPLPYTGLDSTALLIYHGDTLPFAHINTPLCENQDLWALPPFTKYGRWEWVINGQRYITQGDSAFRLPSLSPGAYQLSLTDLAYCLGTYTFNLEISQTPDATFNYSIAADCEHWILEANVNSSVATEVRWKIGNRLIGTGPSLYHLLPSTAEQDGLELLCEVSNSYCQDSSVQLLNFENVPKLPDSLPNVITPNNDQINDFFPAAGIFDAFASCFELTVTNRWGQLVHHASNPDNPFPVNSNNIISGNYFYQLKVGPRHYQGSLRVITQ
ncbi:MAG: gliding motility-associated C-terminal domain-containing protein [Bacteroidia bacterium]